MKARTNKYNTVCMVVGRYNQAGEYREEIYEDLSLNKLDKSIARNVYLNKDVTWHIAPGIEIRVFVKKRKDIDTCFEIEGSRNIFKEILDAFSKHNKSTNGEYIYTSFDFEERRRALAM